MAVPTFAYALLQARRSDDPVVFMVTVSHPAFGTYRLVRNTEDVTSRGETFKASWFEVAEVNDDGELPQAALSVPNVDPDIGRKLLRQPTRPEVTVEVVALSEPDDPIKRIPRLDLRGLEINEVAITGQLAGKDHSAEPLGTVVVLPGNFPALYRRQRKA